MGNLILNYFSFSRTSKGARFITVEVDLQDTKLILTCLHLDHRWESSRLSEIKVIRTALKDVFDKEQAQVWTGDFNALTKKDYTKEEWTQVTDIRAKNNWELPKTDLTDKVNLILNRECL